MCPRLAQYAEKKLLKTIDSNCTKQKGCWLPGTLLHDELGEMYVVIKSWPWDDRVCVLSKGKISLVEMKKFVTIESSDIFSANEVNSGKN